MTTMLERAGVWHREHPNHVHRFVWRPETKNKHCACGAWIHYLDGRIREVYEEAIQSHKEDKE